MADAAVTAPSGGAPRALPRRAPLPIHGLGAAPFFLVAAAFLLLPTAYLVAGSFQARDGSLTVRNYIDLLAPSFVRTYGNGIEISLVTAAVGGIFGFLLAYA